MPLSSETRPKRSLDTSRENRSELGESGLNKVCTHLRPFADPKLRHQLPRACEGIRLVSFGLGIVGKATVAPQSFRSELKGSKMRYFSCLSFRVVLQLWGGCSGFSDRRGCMPQEHFHVDNRILCAVLQHDCPSPAMDHKQRQHFDMTRQ